MSDLRTVIFVDGRNFWYNLRKFKFVTDAGGAEERDYCLDEKHFCWKGFFEGAIRKFNDITKWNHRLIRTYWYFAETVTRFNRWDEGAQHIVEQYQGKFPDLTEDVVHELAEQWYAGFRKQHQDARDVIYEEIQRRVPFLEFRFVGMLFVNAYKQVSIEREANGKFLYRAQIKGEKGVDAGIAVDMLAMLESYDVAVLVSGDADFIPVVKHLKERLKQVYQFSLARGVPPNVTYLSPWLRSVVDLFAYFDEYELLTTYLDRQYRFPAPVWRAIGERIESLKVSREEANEG